MFNPADASAKIKSEFIDYITTTFNFADKDLQSKFREALPPVISKGPFVDIKDVFKTSVSINDLINIKQLSPLFSEIEQHKPIDRIHKKKLPLERKLYSHQERAIEKINQGKNVVITTGTGSGKTECFLIPIINELLKEKEKGTLDEGVRAILIYPMNALANDQMKRLRDILMYYPSITFGVYNGDTKETEKDAKAAYDEIHFNEDCEEIRSPLINELISREQMRATPPHILCTNYAMLEHMLLRPENDVIFSNYKFKFVVLDEAHIYSGATGMETALLLRRLKARIQTAERNAQFILTSATLGEKGKSEENIVRFAENLCGEKFDNKSIIFGERIDEDFSGINEIFVDSSIFSKLINCYSPEEYQSTFMSYGMQYDLAITPEENLYNLCFSSTFYRRMRTSIFGPTNVNDFATALGISLKDAIAFIFICTKAYKNDRALLDARYHFFMRALEGVYAPLYGDKEIYLERKTSKVLDKCECKIYEIALCKNCGEIAIVGTIKDGIIEQVGLYPKGDEKIRYFHICKDDDIDFDEIEYDDLTEIDDDGDNLDKLPKDSSMAKYYLCPKCGKISSFDDGKPKCDCNIPCLLVKEYKNNADNCVYCQNGKYNRFYLGNEAATAVIATSLFEELPSKTVLEREEDIEYEREGGKQFLAFSDSRSEAAFFASYMDKSYKEFLRRRGIIQLINNNREDMIDEPWTVEYVVKKLSKLFLDKETFRDKLISKYSRVDLKIKSNRNAWIAVLTELVNSRRTGSLTSLGFLQFKYAGNDKKAIDYFCRTYNIKSDICKAILDELAMTFAYFGAIGVDDSDIEQEDRKYIFYTYKQKAIYKLKATGAAPEFSGWIARNREGKADAWYKNYRQQLLIERLGVDGKTANKILEDYFDNIIVNKNNEYHAEKGNGNFYYMPAKCFLVKVFGDDTIKWYQCKKCGRITTVNIDNKCPILRCDGKLEEIAELEEIQTTVQCVKVDEKAKQLLKALPKIFATLKKLGANKKGVIFTESVETQKYLFELLKEKYNTVIYNGTSDYSAIQKFKSDGEILISTDTGARGFNLEEACFVVNYDLLYNTLKMEQRIDRCHRLNQQNDVITLAFIDKGNFAEVRKLELVNKRLLVSDGVFGVSDPVVGGFTDDLGDALKDLETCARTKEKIENDYLDTLTANKEENEQIVENAEDILFITFTKSLVDKVKVAPKYIEEKAQKINDSLWALVKYFFESYNSNNSDCTFLIDKNNRTVTATNYKTLPCLFYYWQGNESKRYYSQKQYGMSKDFCPSYGRITLISILGQGILREMDCANSGEIKLETEIETCKIALYSIEIKPQKVKIPLFVGKTASGKVLSDIDCHKIMNLPCDSYIESNHRSAPWLKSSQGYDELDNLLDLEQIIEKQMQNLTEAQAEEVERIKLSAKSKKSGLQEHLCVLFTEIKSLERAFQNATGGSYETACHKKTIKRLRTRIKTSTKRNVFRGNANRRGMRKTNR